MVDDRAVTPPDRAKIDSVKSADLFAAGSVAMMVNWFGFAAYCEQPDRPVKGKVAIAPIPAGSGGESASLNVYWLLSIAAGSRHKQAAYAFITHCASAEMDKLTTLAGGIGCRLSTWSDPEVNAAIPFSSQLASLNEHACELPRSRQFPRLAPLIDYAIHRAISTSDSTGDILRSLQAEASTMRL
jgi:multiple sugar transport system substrate-binding protein